MSKTIWTGTISTDYSVSGNWSNGVPIAGSDVYFSISSLNGVDSGLAQSGVNISSINIDLGYQNFIGTISTYLQLHCPAVTIGLGLPTGNPSGSGRLNLDLGGTAVAVSVLQNTPSPIDAFQAPIRLLGINLTLSMEGGVVGVATGIGEVSLIKSATIDGGTLILGAGCPVDTLNLIQGTVTNSCSRNDTDGNVVDTLTVGGVYIFNGTGSHNSMTILNGGTVTYNGTGTIVDLNLSGTLDLSQGTAPVTIDAVTRYTDGKILDPNHRVTLISGVQDAGGATMQDNGSVFGPNRQWTVV